MRKFSFGILTLTLLLALTTINLFAQGNSDFGRSQREEMEASDAGAKHITPTRGGGKFAEDLNPIAPGQANRGFALTVGGTGATSPITYHGGPVMGTPAIYLIFYGNWNNATGSNTPAGRQIILDWAAGIGTTSRYSINDSFDTSGNNVSGNATFGGYTIKTGSYKTRLRDSEILAQVDSAITSGALGPFNPNGVYFLVTSSDITASSGFCTQYCGWHSYSAKSYGALKYSFIGNADRCLNGCAAQAVSPNGNAGVDGTISILTHELEEAHTDPQLNAWYDASGYENSDKCAWTFGHFQWQAPNGAWANVAFGGRNYLIQRGLLRTGSGDFCMQNATQN
jgi:Phosphate-induced protein 1 conserved region